MSNPSIYTVGGTVQANQNGVYIPRKADEELLALCRENKFAYILTSRQMGKSSLMVRTAEQLADEGIQSVVIDLTQVGVQVTAEQWYLGLLTIIEGTLMLDTDVVQWWQERSHLGFTQRLTLFFEEVLLKEVASPVVIFIDEIDTTLSLDFTDDFFAAIRYLYNARSQKPEFQRLSFVLIGVATPGDLIRDPKRTPFNIGQRVDLTDFTFEEAKPLGEGLGLATNEVQQVLRRVLEWTSGHPYLSQRLCCIVSQQHKKSWSKTDVDGLVSSTFLGAMSEQDNNLQFVRDMLTKRAPDVFDVLTTYREIRRGKHRVFDEEQSLVKSHLKLSGVVRCENKLLHIRNPIYRQMFDDSWITQNLPFRITKKQLQINLITGLSAGFVAAAVILAGVAWGQWQQARISEIKAIVANSESLFALNKEFDSLIEAIRANRKQQQLAVVDSDIHNQVLKQLQQVVYGVVEYNRLLPKDNSDSNLVWDVAISPDGKTIASASQDKTVHLWNRDGSEPRTLTGHGDRVWRVVFSRDNQMIASASEDKTVKLWSRDGKLLHTLTGHSGGVYGVAISPDSQIIAASNDKTVILWRRDGQKLYTLKEHDSAVRAVAFSPDGKVIVSTTEKGRVYFWSRDGRKLGNFQGHKVRVAGVAFSPDGQLMATASDDGTAKLWSRDGKELHTLKGHNDTVWGVAFSPDGQLIATASWDKTIKLWNRDGKLLTTVNGHTARAYGVAFSPDGKIIASTSEDKTVRLWRINNPLLNVLNGHSKPVIGVSFSPNSQLVASASDDKMVKIWNRNGILLKTLPHTDSVLGVEISPDGKTVASGTWDGNIRIWNIDDGKLLRTFNGRSKAIWDVAFSPDGRLMASANFDGTVKLWTLDGKLLHTFNGHSREVREVAFSPDGRLIASASFDGTVKVWTLDGKLLRTFNGHNNAVLGLAFSPDGQTIASASLDGTVKLWKLDGTLLMTLTGHEDGVRGVSFSPDGKVIASASGDGSIKLWRSQDGTLLNTLRGHRSAVWKVKFSPDGEKIVSTSEDKTVILWNREQVQELNPLGFGCNWVRDYLKTNPNVSESDRRLCDGIGIQ